MGMSLALNGLIAYLWYKKFYQKIGLKTYKAIQRIHLNETPRLGGLIFIMSLTSLVAYCDDNQNILFLKLVLVCLIPIIITGLKEDIFYNVEPVIRLSSLFFVGWLFIANYTGPLPNISNVPLVSKVLALQGGISVFYILSMIGIANGMNLIDGVNGLCGAVALSILGALLFISYKTNDIVILSAIFSVILILIPFMIFNYPYGKIFLGDLGAYSLGLIVSMFTIILFGRHPEISPWGAVLILIYPATEVVFSMLRRILKGRSIHHPDKEHIHLKFFHFFKLQRIYKKMANPLVTPALSILWLFPLLSTPWVFQSKIFIWVAIVLFVLCYGFFYVAVSNIQKSYLTN